ncbi:MAG TPA: ACT domain-containing protein [Candidatus Eremiobacteraceae bacterium]|nr:ACT domain-containing protein [Candidatus Eremiobacteraceae bacterium]
MRLTNGDEQQPKRHQLKFRQLPGSYAIVRLAPDSSIPDWAMRGEFTSITRTADELSIVCPAESVPKDFDPGLRWICLKLEGPFPFSQTGILLSFIEPLSNNGIPIFAISTYNTDYVLIPQEHADWAKNLLRKAGHELQSG